MAEHDEDETIVKQQKRARGLVTRPWVVFVLGLVVGALLLAGVRFATYSKHETHYHANFALYIDGQRQKFELPTYYEEVQACGDVESPRGRVHLHQIKKNAEDSYSVHVHDDAVTWGHFFANIGYGLTNGALYDGSRTLVDGQDGKRLNFYLNNEKVSTLANVVIGDEDVLLVTYGNEDAAALRQLADAIPRTASEHNAGQDPAACAGAHEVTFQDRLRAAIGLNEASSHDKH